MIPFTNVCDFCPFYSSESCFDCDGGFNIIDTDEIPGHPFCIYVYGKGYFHGFDYKSNKPIYLNTVHDFVVYFNDKCYAEYLCCNDLGLLPYDFEFRYNFERLN